MAAILRDSTVVAVAAVVRTRPRAIPLAMITMRKSIHGFPLVSYMGMGLRLAAPQAFGAPLSKRKPGYNSEEEYHFFYPVKRQSIKRAEEFEAHNLT